MSNDEKVDGRIAFLKPVRALFLNVLTARKFKKNGKEVGEAKFDGTFVLDTQDTKEVYAKAKAVAAAKWPGKDLKEIAFPFKSAEKAMEKATAKGKDPAIYTAGTWVLTARSQYAPTLSRFVGGKPVALGAADAAEAKQKFYNGAFVVPQVNFVPYVTDKGEHGITAYLDAVLWVKDGPRIGGGSDPAEAFKGYVGTLSNEDPTGSDLDDEIPF